MRKIQDIAQDMDQNILDSTEAGKILNVHHSTVRRIAQRGLIPHEKWHREYVFNRADVLKFKKSYKKNKRF